MARIRTVKPELFRHKEIYHLERETGLPIRTAWMGLFTLCDRDGRFKWDPDSMKLDILPWDDLNMEKVLLSLLKAGLIRHYRVLGKQFGDIPTWRLHQVINNKEKPSDIPPFPTRGRRVKDACPTPLFLSQGEGKGREGKGKGKEGEREGKSDVHDFAHEARLQEICDRDAAIKFNKASRQAG